MQNGRSQTPASEGPGSCRQCFALQDVRSPRSVQKGSQRAEETASVRRNRVCWGWVVRMCVPQRPGPPSLPPPLETPLSAVRQSSASRRGRGVHVPFSSQLCWGGGSLGIRNGNTNGRWCNERRWLALTWGGHGLRNYLRGPRTVESKSALKRNVCVRLSVTS